MKTVLKDRQLDDLFDAILALKTREECYALFEDLFTVLELKSVSQRYEVARMLAKHYVYSDIVSETGASTATISRVNRSLNYGNGGYEMIFKRLEDKDSAEKEKK